MDKKLVVTLCALLLLITVDGKKSFKSRASGSGRGTSRKTNYNPQPAPTSLSYPQPAAPKPSLFGWQEKPKNAQTFTPKQTKPQQTHSYPSSQTGMSGNNQHKQQPHQQDNIQRSSAPQSTNNQQTANSQPAHSYPVSNGMSGSSGSSYPKQSAPGGLSGNTGGGYPPQSPAAGSPNHGYPSNSGGSGYPHGQTSGVSGAAAPPPYPGNANRPPNGGTYPNNNYGNSYQPPPPPYSSGGFNNGGYGGHGGNYGGNYGGYGGNHGGYGGNYGGYGGHPGFNPQTPGFFGNYGNKGFGGVSRGSSALKGVGIAGAGVGTLLTGLALWNLARSTGHHHHTVIYDNRGQPVAVAPANNTAPEVDPILADLVNCTLSISNGNNTEVLAIPCSIATSFTPDADIKESEKAEGENENTKCTVTVMNKSGQEFMTTIPCSILLNTAAENNVTEPPLVEDVAESGNINATANIEPVPVLPDVPIVSPQPAALSLSDGEGDSKINNTQLDCVPQPGETRDPINPCYAITHNVTVVPLPITEKNEDKPQQR